MVMLIAMMPVITIAVMLVMIMEMVMGISIYKNSLLHDIAEDGYTIQ